MTVFGTIGSGGYAKSIILLNPFEIGSIIAESHRICYYSSNAKIGDPENWTIVDFNRFFERDLTSSITIFNSRKEVWSWF